MIPAKDFKQLSGGLYAALLPYNKAIPLHRTVLADTLRDIIEHEAKVHGTNLDDKNFERVMKAFDADIIRVSFFIAAWNVCKPKVIGAEISVPTVAMDWDGRDLKVRRARHSEDVCLLPAKIRQLVAEKPPEKFFPPDTGLGAHFDRESIRQMRTSGEVWRYGEFAPTNTKIRRILSQTGTILGTESDSGIIRLTDFTPVMRNRMPVPIEVNGISYDTEGFDLSNNIFLTRWSNRTGSQQIALSFTNSASTFRGMSLAQSRFLHTDHLPTVAELKDILTSLILAGHNEIRERQWSSGPIKPKASPIIPLNAPRSEIFAALLSAGHDELMDRKPNRSFSFGGFTPETHFHAIKQPKIIAALKELDMEDRILGSSHRMVPGALEIVKKGKLFPDRPVTIVEPNAVPRPQFSLAA